MVKLRSKAPRQSANDEGLQGEFVPESPQVDASQSTADTYLGSSACKAHLGEAAPSADGNELYFIGIIDTLSTYRAAKMAQDLEQRFVASVKFQAATHSVVNPKIYRERQIAFFRRA